MRSKAAKFRHIVAAAFLQMQTGWQAYTGLCAEFKRIISTEVSSASWNVVSSRPTTGFCLWALSVTSVSRFSFMWCPKIIQQLHYKHLHAHSVTLAAHAELWRTGNKTESLERRQTVVASCVPCRRSFLSVIESVHRRSVGQLYRTHPRHRPPSERIPCSGVYRGVSSRIARVGHDSGSKEAVCQTTLVLASACM